jgi:hypothetical protein
MKFLPDGEQVDFKAMIFHSCAFGLFMLSVLFYAVMNTLYNFFPISQEVHILFTASGLLYNVLQFISQCFIIIVFRRLGRKNED